MNTPQLVVTWFFIGVSAYVLMGTVLYVTLERYWPGFKGWLRECPFSGVLFIWPIVLILAVREVIRARREE